VNVFGIPIPGTVTPTPAPVRVVANVKTEPKPAQDARTMRECPRCHARFSLGALEPDPPCSTHEPFGRPTEALKATEAIEKVAGHTGIELTAQEEAVVVIEALNEVIVP
jgi:hypothetical protein